MDLLHDARFAARLFAKDQRSTAASVLALALGIAANTTVFTFINAALFKDLPFEEPHQLVALGERDERGRPLQLSYPDYQDWQRATRTLAGLAAYAGSSTNLSEEGLAPERFRGAYVSANTFQLLRAKAMLGRTLLPEDERPGATPVLVISNEVWQARYHADRTVLGRSVRVNDIPSIIVGVMPKRFSYPGTAEVWQPLALMPGIVTATRDARNLNVLGRLKESVTADQARADLNAIAGQIAQDHPDSNRGITATVTVPLESMRRSIQPMLLTLMGAVGFVLLIACANMANLLLARAAQRAREMAIRSSLGATRWRIVRQLLIESLLLATAAGAVGLFLSMYGVRYFGVAFDAMETGAPDRAATPYWIDLSMDATIFAFVAALCLGTTLLFGLAPALHVSKAHLNDVLKQSGQSTSGSLRARRWSGALMVVEIALTIVLLTGAGLAVRSFLALYTTNLVIDTAHLYTARMTLPIQKYSAVEQRKTFLDRLDERLAANPVFEAATVASDIPLASLGGSMRQLSIDGRSNIGGGRPPTVMYVYVGARYFETLGLRAFQGRTLLPEDGDSGREAAVVNQRFAEMFFGSGDPIGRRIRLAAPAAPGLPPDIGPWLTIVGVTPTLPQFGPGQEAGSPMVFASARSEPIPGRFVSIIVRGRTAATGLSTIVPILREDVRAIDADLPLYFFQSFDDVVARTRYPHRLIGSLFGLLALIALVLACVGLYALTAYAVTRRTQEIGVRMALGARKLQVVWLLLRGTLVQLAIGVPIGVGGALGVGQLLPGFLVRTGARDPVTLGSIVALLVLVSLAACFVPARRAARVDPAVALRYE
jgi:putative ABC transport system permease protein